jgi:glucose/arabinose dehydrogenase
LNRIENAVMTVSSLAYLSLALLPALSLAQSSCSIATSSASYAAPSVAAGYTARIIASGLKKPRSLRFDSKGRLLVVESGKGITALTLKDAGGACVGVSSKSAVLNDATLNHGIEMSADGKSLYASNSDKAMRWAYNPDTAGVSGQPTTLVQGMDNPDHTTRTLLLSKKAPGTLLVSRGSNDNIDSDAANVESGRSQLRSFNVNSSNVQAQDYATAGTRIGWGLRNSVGIAEHPISGGIFSVENSADDVQRLGQDIHTNNPGEEMNFHGYLNGTQSSVQGGNYGYPQCFAVWNATEIPQNSGLTTGSQFQLGDNPDDAYCANNTIPPRLTFPAHWAPLDIVFNTGGTVAYITSHGSW